MDGPSTSTQPLPAQPGSHSMASGAGAGATARTTTTDGPPIHPTPKRRKNHRGGKKKRTRRKSFAAPQDEMQQDDSAIEDPALSAARNDFYSLRNRNNSATSIDSENLLDHRGQQPFLRPRRPSLAPAAASSFQPQFQFTQGPSRLRTVHGGDSGGDEEDEQSWNEGAPLLSHSARLRASEAAASGPYGSNDRGGPSRSRSRRRSSLSSLGIKFTNTLQPSGESYNINYPPSVPGSPLTRPSDRGDMNFGDAMLREELRGDESPRRGKLSEEREAAEVLLHPSPMTRRQTMPRAAEEDVCFPQEGLSEIADEEFHHRDEESSYRTRPRRRRGKWPDLAIFDEWSRFEKEGRSEMERRAKKITEPQLVNGRLRPVHRGWYRTEEDAPYRFTYFNEEFQSTIHSQTISELVQPGGSFRELFVPDPPVLSDSESDEEEEPEAGLHRGSFSLSSDCKPTTREPPAPAPLPPSAMPIQAHQTGTLSPSQEREGGSSNARSSHEGSGTATPAAKVKSPSPGLHPRGLKSPPPRGKAEKPIRYGERPVWWLDVLSPTEAEMKVLSKAFGIHPLTAEDIMMQEAREKVELFRHYYFVNYRSFDQDQNSENYLDPVDMYVVVFREGVLSFHFSMTPHPANVRRRIRQLRDYMILSSDWISYAIIDDITDAFVPLIHNIEDEVDDIDDAILQMHSSVAGQPPSSPKDGRRDGGEKTGGGGETLLESGSDMLRRVGDCRKRVMGLYRLLGNKADVIKGFAKRCNEHWEVAPRSEIGLYLGDIQDHIVTMTSNLGHYEKILARAHGNYLAQINIRMNERQEQTADVLGKLTVLGTIVLPMNIITGLWGMNVWVPGQEHEGDLAWFLAITAGLLLFGMACYWIAKRVYKIV